MSAESKRSYGSTLVLVVLGVLALYCSSQWLMLLIPAATLVSYATVRTSSGQSRDWPKPELAEAGIEETIGQRKMVGIK